MFWIKVHRCAEKVKRNVKCCNQTGVYGFAFQSLFWPPQYWPGEADVQLVKTLLQRTLQGQVKQQQRFSLVRSVGQHKSHLFILLRVVTDMVGNRGFEHGDRGAGSGGSVQLQFLVQGLPL